jgi:hypothetical protein
MARKAAPIILICIYKGEKLILRHPKKACMEAVVKRKAVDSPFAYSLFFAAGALATGSREVGY